MDELPFWKRKTLSQMNPEEWESLCDGCAKCCLEKLENARTGEISYTNVACPLLDLDTCRCVDYTHRAARMADCVALTPEVIPDLGWMPSTCAYRLIHEGRDLPWWHRLVCGDGGAVHRHGRSVHGRVVPENMAGDLWDHEVKWPE